MYSNYFKLLPLKEFCCSITHDVHHLSFCPILFAHQSVQSFLPPNVYNFKLLTISIHLIKEV